VPARAGAARGAYLNSVRLISLIFFPCNIILSAYPTNSPVSKTPGMFFDSVSSSS